MGEVEGFLARTNYEKGGSYHVIKYDGDHSWTAGLGVMFYI